MGDFEKNFPASACRKKKIACSTNVIESLWEKKGKNILPTRLLEKIILDQTPRTMFFSLEKVHCSRR